MLHVLGAGYAYPETELSGQFLESLGIPGAAAFAAKSGIASRRTSLPLEYLSATRNADPREGSKAAAASSVELGRRAAVMALERAGITAEQLTCLIGDASTPIQSTPSEGQQVANLLGLNLPSYDLTAGVGPIPLQLHTLMQWKEDRVPEYCLLVVGCTPTHRINYDGKGDAPLYFGDGAAAFVVSTKHKGKLAVAAADYSTDLSQRQTLAFDKFNHAAFDAELFGRIYEGSLATVTAEAMAKVTGPRSAVRYVASPFNEGIANKVAAQFEIAPSQRWSHAAWAGNALSASVPAVIAERWGAIAAGEKIVCAHVGAGVTSGYVVFDSVA